MKKYIHNFIIAVESILANKLRSVLTALGIIFGVAAVISMLAIGNGAQKEILDQIEMVGVNNIVISPIVQSEVEEGGNSEEGNGERQSKRFSPGLTLEDVDAIKQFIPSVKMISPEISMNSYVVQGGRREAAKLVGVGKEYFKLYSLDLHEGNFFNDIHEENGDAICVIGYNIRARFFSNVNPIGQYIKFGNVWLKVVGVLERRTPPVSGFEFTGVNVHNDNIYIPVKTMLLRFQNRALVTSRRLDNVSSRSGGRMIIAQSSDPSQNTRANYHQLDRLIVQVHETEQLTPTTKILSRMLTRRHMGVNDFEITVPELLLKQQQRTKDIFNIVLGAIAGISLLVGGIGIMNIMFASVMERIREIGTRMAIGATKKDIVIQFLAEAVLISITGGLIGVALGVVLAKLINHFADILTIVSPFSVIIAFVVSASVGIIFGYSPAKRASERDPIESLRYE